MFRIQFRVIALTKSYLGRFLKEHILVGVGLIFRYPLIWILMNKIVKFCRKVLIFLNLCQKPGRFPKIRFLANQLISLAVWKCQLSAMKLDTSSPTRSIFSQDTPWREGFFLGSAGNLNPEAELARSFAFLMFWQHLLK